MKFRVALLFAFISLAAGAKMSFKFCDDLNCGEHGFCEWGKCQCLKGYTGDKCETPILDGGWGAWTKWSECRVSCGGADQFRTRSCDSPAPSPGGAGCKGEKMESQRCNENPCPIDCQWNAWTIGECSLPCGTGTREERRTKIKEQFGGAPCDGKELEIVECNTSPCVAVCEWGAWEYGECSAECGGGLLPKIRFRGGGPGCEAEEQETEECNAHPCPVDCEWDDWTFGECDLPCGGGLRMDTRVKIVEQYGGAACIGEESRIEACNTFSCPVDCQWGEWTIGECSKTCGGGRRLDTRVKIVEQFGGHPCVGDDSIIEACNTDPCPVSDCADQYGFCSRYVTIGACGEGILNSPRWLLDFCPVSCGVCPGAE